MIRLILLELREPEHVNFISCFADSAGTALYVSWDKQNKSNATDDALGAGVVDEGPHNWPEEPDEFRDPPGPLARTPGDFGTPLATRSTPNRHHIAARKMGSIFRQSSKNFSKTIGSSKMLFGGLKDMVDVI